MDQSAAARGLRDATVVVTGGSGVLGRAVVAALVEAGVGEVRVVDPLPPARPAPQVRWVAADAADEKRLGDAAQDAAVLLHLAGCLPQALLGDAGFEAANVWPTAAVVRAAARCRARRVVLASTIELYGPCRGNVDERTPLRPIGPYARSKAAAEQVLFGLGAELGVETVSLRLPMILGPGFHHERSTLMVLRLFRRGLPVPVPADVRVTYVSARDAATAFLLAACADGGAGGAFNIGACDHPSASELFGAVASRIGSRSRPVVVPRRVVAVAVSAALRLGRRRGAVLGTPVDLLPYALTGGVYDSTAAREVLGWRAQDSCVDAWVQLYEWWHSGERARSPQGAGPL